MSFGVLPVSWKTGMSDQVRKVKGIKMCSLSPGCPGWWTKMFSSDIQNRTGRFNSSICPLQTKGSIRTELLTKQVHVSEHHLSLRLFLQNGCHLWEQG